MAYPVPKLLPGTLEWFLGMPKIKVVSETPYPWAACTFHTLSNKVLHKTRCAKDRRCSKHTFGNRFEVYWHDADDGVLHEDDWHFKLVRWQLIALYVIIGKRQSLSEKAVGPKKERQSGMVKVDSRLQR